MLSSGRLLERMDPQKLHVIAELAEDPDPGRLRKYVQTWDASKAIGHNSSLAQAFAMATNINPNQANLTDLAFNKLKSMPPDQVDWWDQVAQGKIPWPFAGIPHP